MMKLNTILLSSLLVWSGLFATSAPAQADESDIASSLKACNQAVAEGDGVKALGHADKILKQDKANRAALLCKGRALTVTGQFQEALAILQSAEKLSATPIEHMTGLTFIANVHKEAKHYPEALSVYRQSLAIAQAQKDKRFERINLNQIGETLVDSNQPLPGLESYLTASNLSANDNERADSYARIASTYSTLGKHDQAIEYQVKALVLEERAGDLDHYANATLELGRIYIAAKDYDKAEKTIDKIVKLSKEQGGAYWEAKAYYYLALAKTANGQSVAAKPLLDDAQRISQQIGAQSLNDEIQQTLAKLN